MTAYANERNILRSLLSARTTDPALRDFRSLFFAEMASGAKAFEISYIQEDETEVVLRQAIGFQYLDSRLGWKMKSPSASAWCQATFLSITRSGRVLPLCLTRLRRMPGKAGTFARKESSDLGWAHAICSIGAM